ncbi:efflux RND transporter periplasmic adaptor subunit [Bradyrhizobium liaoningense]|uniref:efflux RND transporter periplasmic adaptor subunit n=1 Tax=Bradyrhizobium liaoningense TaxID=43992 RepID=UPI001BAC6E8E|nr:efflux RND transporter periplasmic adaptor subunit [Bradyrhizobium liaoningense]MBR0706991.1 efflux RND transporter periplasmic adaptor subunit [Bradyrhizobium liaoningense]
MSSNRIWVLLVLGGCLPMSGCMDKLAEPVRPVLSTVVTPMQSDGAVIVGTVQPQFKTDLGFRVLGHLIARPVNVGDRVDKGQIVAAIDPIALELAVRSAAADLVSSRAQLSNATGVEGRQRTLIETDATSKATLEAAEQARAAAQSSVVRAQANLTKAQEQLGYTQLKADFTGVVTAVSAQVGQVVTPGQSVVTIARPDIREAVIDVSEEIASDLRIGLQFTVSLQIDPEVHSDGRVREIAPQADATTRLRRIRITLDDPPATFRLGTTVVVNMSGSRKALWLPRSAILSKDGQTMVWLLDSSTSTVTLRTVEIASDDRNSVRLESGLEPGVRVVTAGVHSLKEGQKVRLDQEPVQ